eukprot:scaffold3777_cov335-Prasinococcus_capsulatus_cf.AAC.2
MTGPTRTPTHTLRRARAALPLRPRRVAPQRSEIASSPWCARPRVAADVEGLRPLALALLRVRGCGALRRGLLSRWYSQFLRVGAVAVGAAYGSYRLGYLKVRAPAGSARSTRRRRHADDPGRLPTDAAEPGGEEGRGPLRRRGRAPD